RSGAPSPGQVSHDGIIFYSTMIQKSVIPWATPRSARVMELVAVEPRRQETPGNERAAAARVKHGGGERTTGRSVRLREWPSPRGDPLASRDGDRSRPRAPGLGRHSGPNR